MAFVVKAETASEVIPIIKQFVTPGNCIMSDSSTAYFGLFPTYDHRKVNHSVEYRTEDGTNNNQAESFFSGIRRAEYGVFNGMRSKFLYLYLAEFVWRTNVRGKSLKDKFHNI